MCATGVQVFSHTGLSGMNVDPHCQAVFKVTHVENPGYIGSLCHEPLVLDKLIVWGLENTIEAEENTPHAKVRRIATTNYLKATNRQQKNFDALTASKRTVFSKGDNVGISIHPVDRTNTGRRNMP